MTKGEQATIQNVINRLRCKPRSDGNHRETEGVRNALQGEAKIYLDTWVTSALECLLEPHRDVRLAESLSS